MCDWQEVISGVSTVHYRRRRCIGYLSAGRGFEKSKRSRTERHVWLLCYLMIAGMCFMHRVCEADYISSRVTAKVTVCTEADYHFLLTTLNRHHHPLRWKVHSVQCRRKKRKKHHACSFVCFFTGVGTNWHFPGKVIYWLQGQLSNPRNMTEIQFDLGSMRMALSRQQWSLVW